MDLTDRARVPSKVCSKCKIGQPLSGYHRSVAKKDGHVSACKRCVLEQKKAYREANPDKVAARNRAWYMANRHQQLAYQKAYNEDEANRDRRIARDKARYDEKWATDREFRARYHAAEIRRRRLLASAEQEPYLRQDIFERDGWVCGLCDGPIDPGLTYPDPGFASIDHVVPISLGGGDTPANTQASHLRCNLSKRNRVDLDTAV